MSVTVHRYPQRQRRWVALAVIGLGADIAVSAAGTLRGWRFTPDITPATLAAWSAAAVLAVTVFIAVTRRGRHAGWFHPLSLPFAVLAVMSVGAELWVHYTRQSGGLLYEPGYESSSASALAVAVSPRACEALALVLGGYLAGCVVALALSGKQAVTVNPGPVFSPGLRRTGFALMATGAVAEMAAAWLGRGTVYGVGQFQYGPAGFLQPAAVAALLAGLIAATAGGERLSRFRDLLSGREWAVLAIYLAAVVGAGGRASLIGPLVYLAWVYSARVRAVRLRWVVIAGLAAVSVSAVIASYRSDEGVSPGSPASVAQGAVSAVSSPAWLTQQTVATVPSAVPYARGATYVAAAEGQLPGPLARRLGVTTRTASAAIRGIIGFTDPNQGFAESLPSEAYLNAGLPGCAAVGLLLGALTGWAWRRSRAWAVRPLDLLYPVMLAGLAAGFRSDALAQVKLVLYPLLVVWALMTWYRIPVRRQPR